MRVLKKYIPFVLAAALLQSCSDSVVSPDYRAEMRQFVIKINESGEALRPGFIVVPQNGLELMSKGRDVFAIDPSTEYLAAIDGCGQEELFYGYDNQNNFISQTHEEAQIWLNYCVFAQTHNLAVLVTDYCSAPDLVTDSYDRNESAGFISFAAESRELDLIPSYTHNENTNNILTLADAQNFLYMINPTQATKEELIVALEQSHHDVIIIDAFFDGTEALTAADLARLRNKPQGGTRLVLSYMSIGQAESYRWYWKPRWLASPPSFLIEEDPYWNANYYVRYWDSAWQQTFTGDSEDSYVHRIVAAGFDGVYLDLVNAYEYFEAKE